MGALRWVLRAVATVVVGSFTTAALLVAGLMLAETLVEVTEPTRRDTWEM